MFFSRISRKGRIVSMVLEFLLLRWRWIVGTLLFGAMGIVLLIQWSPKPLFFARAEERVEKWEKTPENTALYKEMEKMIKKAPGLEEKYGAQIAQHLIHRGKIQEASTWASAPLEALQKEAPLHAAFGKISLFIEQGMFQEALERSVRLKKEVGRKALLGAYNLLRIAFLQKELDNRPGEKAAWEELETFLAESSEADLFYGNFQRKGADLTHYIAKRKQRL